MARLAAALLAAALLSVPAGAVRAEGRAATLDPDNLSLTVGAGAMVVPDYPGSDDFTVRPLPVVRADMDGWATLDSREGLSVALLRTPAFRGGLRLGYAWGRDAGDNDALTGLGDIDGAATAGAFGTWQAGPWRLGLAGRKALGGADGVTATLHGGYGWRLGRSARLRATLSTTWADGAHMAEWFGISTAQAARSAHARHGAGAGLREAGLGLTLRESLTGVWGLDRDWTEGLGMLWTAGGTRLLGDAADSPLVDGAGDAIQLRAGAALTWSF